MDNTLFLVEDPEFFVIRILSKGIEFKRITGASLFLQTHLVFWSSTPPLPLPPPPPPPSAHKANVTCSAKLSCLCLPVMFSPHALSPTWRRVCCSSSHAPSSASGSARADFGFEFLPSFEPTKRKR